MRSCSTGVFAVAINVSSWLLPSVGVWPRLACSVSSNPTLADTATVGCVASGDAEFISEVFRRASSAGDGCPYFARYHCSNPPLADIALEVCFASGDTAFRCGGFRRACSVGEGRPYLARYHCSNPLLLVCAIIELLTTIARIPMIRVLLASVFMEISLANQNV